MKLIGSRAEKEMREELVNSNLALQDGSYGRLVSALKSENIFASMAYVINWIPEQGEDIYVVMASINEVVIVEVPRGEGDVLLEQVDISLYEGKCSKVQRMKIAVAQDLLLSMASKISK
ncbi:hypothetical protein M5C99_06805 [Acidovorax sp. NCPPB 2350]|nr:hypothetical protein M5C99_06805 [Acidovorax sp. NCPPB 2350]